MVIFFLLVGMEIKREVVEGELSHLSKVALPIAGAVGGIVLPALIYVGFTWKDPVALHGWAIPSATDIAFAVAVLSALGKRVPLGLKLFLLTLAIVDDLAAILIIAIFYTADLSAISLALAGGCLVALLALNLAGVRRFTPYLVLGVVLWLCVLKSGVHATLSGVALAFLLPLKGGAEPRDERAFVTLEHALKPWVSFLVMPVFAFANSGLDLAGITPEMATNPVTLGIVAGLFFGKQFGVFAASWALIRLGMARLPDGANWGQLYGVSACAGIGFTMSLFIGTLAFSDPALQPMVRLGVLVASLLSAALGYVLCSAAARKISR
jgi:NhaA family Na+:H+ antiporter